MDALDNLLQPLVRLLNRQLRQVTPARDLGATLEGKAVAIRVNDTALAACFVIRANEIILTSTLDTDPDVVISGSLLSLAQLLRTGGEELIRDGAVSLSGDALLASQFRDLLKYARPDPEELLSRVVGDAGAHTAGQFARSIDAWGKAAHRTMTRNVIEYLQEESRSVPHPHEAEHFYDKVAALRDDVARFEARLRIVESRAGTRSSA